MKNSKWSKLVVRILIGLAPGTVLLGTGSCASDIRDTLVDAGLDFVGDSAGNVLDLLFPVEEIVTGEV